jgi:hypothetical protein
VAAWGHLFYLWKCIWPYPLSAFYPYPLPPRSFPLNYWFAPVIILALLGYAVYLFRIKKYPQLLYSFLSYGIILFPVSQILPVGSAVTADRYFYLSSIGICFLLAWGYTYFEKWNLKIAQISMLMIAFLWTGLSNQRSRVWHDTVTLFKDVIQHYPQVPVAYNNIGNVYSEEGLIKYRNFYIIFGSMGIAVLIASAIGLILDIKDFKRYIEQYFINNI